MTPLLRELEFQRVLSAVCTPRLPWVLLHSLQINDLYVIDCSIGRWHKGRSLNVTSETAPLRQQAHSIHMAMQQYAHLIHIIVVHDLFSGRGAKRITPPRVRVQHATRLIGCFPQSISRQRSQNSIVVNGDIEDGQLRSLSYSAILS